MKKVLFLGAAALLASTAYAEDAPKAPAQPQKIEPKDITLSAQEVVDTLNLLNQSDIMIKLPNGSIQPYLPQGTSRVITLLQQKEATANGLPQPGAAPEKK